MRHHFGAGDALVVSAVAGFGGGRDDRFGQRIVLAQSIGEIDAVDCALTLAVAIPERRRGDAANEAAHNYLHRQWTALAPHCHIWIGHAEKMIAHNVPCPLEPERRQLIQYLSFVRHQPQNPIKRRQPIRGHKDQPIPLIVDLAHLAAGLRAEKGQVYAVEGVREGGGELFALHECLVTHYAPSPEKSPTPTVPAHPADSGSAGCDLPGGA